MTAVREPIASTARRSDLPIGELELDAHLAQLVRRTSIVRQGFYVVVLLVALAGQVSGAVEALHIPLAAAVPAVAALELGGIVVLANADVRRRLGERAIASRILSVAIAASAVAFNWLAHRNHLLGAFFAGMSALGYLVWLMHTENQRRDRLRIKGDLPPTTPGYEMVGHWLRHPMLTLRARAMAKADPRLGLYDSLAEARAEIRRERRQAAIAKVLHRKIRAAVDPKTADIAIAVYDLDEIAARLAERADYDGLTTLIAADLAPERLAPDGLAGGRRAVIAKGAAGSGVGPAGSRVGPAGSRVGPAGSGVGPAGSGVGSAVEPGRWGSHQAAGGERDLDQRGLDQQGFDQRGFDQRGFDQRGGGRPAGREPDDHRLVAGRPAAQRARAERPITTVSGEIDDGLAEIATAASAPGPAAVGNVTADRARLPGPDTARSDDGGERRSSGSVQPRPALDESATSVAAAAAPRPAVRAALSPALRQDVERRLNRSRTPSRRSGAETRASFSDEPPPEPPANDVSLRRRVHAALDANVLPGDQRDDSELIGLVFDELHLNEHERLVAATYVRSWRMENDSGQRIRLS